MIYLNLLETDADRDVFQKFYEENKQIFFLTAMKYLQNEADAEDAVQTCFERMIDNFATYRHKSNVEWTRLGQTIVRHLAIDILRNRKRKADFIDDEEFWEDNIPDVGPDILDSLIQKYENEIVKQAIMLLSPEEQGILRLQYVLDLKPREIAKQLGTTSAVVRKKTFNIRCKLAKILEGLDYESL